MAPDEKRYPQEPAPPRWVDKLLERFCAPHKREEVLGDLHERYYYLISQVGPTQAKRRYYREVLSYLRPSVFKRKQKHYYSSDTSPRFTQTLSLTMFSHHVLLAYRTFLRFKGTFLINLTGLSAGLACTLLIYLWVKDEVSMDKFHEKDGQLY